MRKILIAAVVAVCIASCKPTEDSVRNFDMSRFCNTYYVLVPTGRSTQYVFIDRQDMSRRFIIWKDFNAQGSGYGFCYSYVPLGDMVLQNGVYSSPQKAVQKALKNMPTDSKPVWLHNMMPLGGEDQWVSMGQIYNNLCGAAR